VPLSLSAIACKQQQGPLSTVVVSIPCSTVPAQPIFQRWAVEVVSCCSQPHSMVQLHIQLLLSSGQGQGPCTAMEFTIAIGTESEMPLDTQHAPCTAGTMHHVLTNH